MTEQTIDICAIAGGCCKFSTKDVASIRADRFRQYMGLCSSGVNNNIVKLRGMQSEGDEFETFTYIVLPEKIEKEVYIKFVGDKVFKCGHSVIESISWKDMLSCVNKSDYHDDMNLLKQYMFDEICSDIEDYANSLQDKEEDGEKLTDEEGEFVDTYLKLTYTDEDEDEDEDRRPSDYFIDAGDYAKDARDVLTKYFNIESCYKLTFAKIASIMDQYVSYFEEQIFGFIMLMDEDSVTFKPRNGKGKF